MTKTLLYATKVRPDGVPPVPPATKNRPADSDVAALVKKKRPPVSLAEVHELPVAFQISMTSEIEPGTEQANEILNNRVISESAPSPPAKNAREAISSDPQLNDHRGILSCPVVHRRAAGSFAKKKSTTSKGPDVVRPPPAKIAMPSCFNDVAQSNVLAALSVWVLLHLSEATSYISTLL